MKARGVKLALAAIVLGMFVESASASVTNSRTIYWFDANENLVGQSILYCSNDPEHAGVTSGSRRVTITYSCEDYQTKTISYSNVSASLRASFCSLYDDGEDICNMGPWRYGGFLTWHFGFYH